VSNPSSIVEVAGLSKRYGPATVVDNISFGTKAGELLTLLGPSGCGKTTLLRCIAGFIEPDAGSIRIGGEAMDNVPPHRRQIGMVFQSYALFPHMSVSENVGFGLSIRGRPKAELEQKVRAALDMTHLTALSDRMPKQLSGGQQQRVALARALAYSPRVLLLDEPLSNLDAKLRVELRTEIRRLQLELGLTAISVTHDQEEALSISDRVIVMNGGKVEQISSPWEIYNKPDTEFVASFVGTANILPVDVTQLPNGRCHASVRGAFAVEVPTASSPSTKYKLMIRPDAVQLFPPEVGGGGIAGTVRSVTLVGSVFRIEVDVGPHNVTVELAHSGAENSFVAGQHVGLSIQPERASLVRQSN
jgi:putative spermidine/putrescine transport system ATP-binding protein